MRKSKANLAEFEVTDGLIVTTMFFGKSLSAEQVRSMLIMFDGMSHDITVKKLDKK